MLILTLDDAAKVAKWLVDDGMNNEVIIRQELEQKCWLPVREPAKQLASIIIDINPAEIALQIQNDNLREWCEEIRVNMQLAVMQMGNE